MTIKKNSTRERKIRVKQKIERVREKGNVKTTKETNMKISKEKRKGEETNKKISQEKGKGEETNKKISQEKGKGEETNKKISQEKGKGGRVDEEEKRKSKRKEDKVLKKIQRGRKRYKEEK